MKNYEIKEIVKAEEMTRGDYNIYRGWKIPSDENPNDKGYKVERNNSHVSWFPKETFDIIAIEITTP